jgi:hypothetical protein
MKSHFEVTVFVAWLFEALRSAKAWKSQQYVPLPRDDDYVLMPKEPKLKRPA